MTFVKRFYLLKKAGGGTIKGAKIKYFYFMKEKRHFVKNCSREKLNVPEARPSFSRNKRESRKRRKRKRGGGPRALPAAGVFKTLWRGGFERGLLAPVLKGW
jgi:hypothetical protein